MNKVLTLIFLSSVTIILAQTKPLYFTYPTNGAVISIPEGQSSVTLVIQYDYTGNLATNEKHELGACQTYSSSVYPYNLVSSPPVNCTLTAGAYTWKLSRYLWEWGLGYQLWGTPDEITFYVRPSITVRTSFGGGQLLVNSVPRANGYNFTPEPNSTTYLNVEDQSSGDYLRVFTDWAGISGDASIRNNYVFAPTALSSTITANMPKLCNLTFSNPGRAIYLNGNTYNSSVSANVVEQNTVSPGAEGYFVVNGIEHAFQNLWKSSSSGQNYATVTASQHDTYTAVYRIQAVNPAISFGTTLNMPIVINWADNQNSNVTQYRIHRREYNNGWSADQIIATVNSGVQTYTDNDYILKPWRQNTWLEYGITAYYTVNSTWSTGGANTQVYGLQTLMQTDESTLINTEKEVPTDYSISNHPNPFNPTTTINYQLPQDGMVTIKVYDIIGKEVATLVNEQKSAGYYKVDFDASRLTSGVYIATIQASGFNKSIKLLLTK